MLPTKWPTTDRNKTVKEGVEELLAQTTAYQQTKENNNGLEAANVVGEEVKIERSSC